MDVENLILKYDNLLRDYNSKEGKRDLLLKNIQDKESKIQVMDKRIELLQKTSLFLQLAAEALRATTKKRIEDLVTFALQTIMGDGYRFEIKYEILRNAPNARFIVWTKMGDEWVELDPINSKGGSISDVLSIAMRIIFLRLSLPVIEGPMIIDEEGESFDDINLEKMGQFMKDMSKTMNRQIISITHEEKFLPYASKVIKIVQDENGVSKLG